MILETKRLLLRPWTDGACAATQNNTDTQNQ